MFKYKNVVVDDWAMEEISRAINRIFSTPEREEKLLLFEAELSRNYYREGKKSK